MDYLLLVLIIIDKNRSSITTAWFTLLSHFTLLSFSCYSLCVHMLKIWCSEVQKWLLKELCC